MCQAEFGCCCMAVVTEDGHERGNTHVCHMRCRFNDVFLVACTQVLLVVNYFAPPDLRSRRETRTTLSAVGKGILRCLDLSPRGRRPPQQSSQSLHPEERGKTALNVRGSVRAICSVASGSCPDLSFLRLRKIRVLHLTCKIMPLIKKCSRGYAIDAGNEGHCMTSAVKDSALIQGP